MPGTETDRGVAPLIGFILLFALVAAGTAAVVVVGGAAIDGTQTQVDTNSANTLFQTVDKKASDLERFSTANSAVVPVPDHLTGQVEIDHNEAWINVSVSPSGSNTVCETGRINMGTMRYERDSDTVLVYQAGGIFHDTDSGITIASNPSVKYEQSNLQFRVLNFTKDQDVPNNIVLSNDPSESQNKTQSVQQTLRNCLAGTSGDGEPPTIGVQVHSQYASGWEQFLTDAYPNQSAIHWEHNNTVKAVFEPENATGPTPTSDVLCSNDEEGEYRWDVKRNGERTELRLICGHEDENGNGNGQIRVRYEYDRLDAQDTVNITVNDTHRRNYDKWTNHTRWRFNQSSRDLYRLHTAELRKEGEWQTNTSGSWDEISGDEDFNQTKDNRTWRRDDDPESAFPDDELSMGPPDAIAGSLLEKHPYLNVSNLKESPRNSPNVEKALRRLRESPGSSGTDTFRPADFVQLKIFQVSADESE